MLINLRNALMAGKRLPYDAEVEYLESTGTQYVNTGVLIDTSTDTVEIAFMPHAETSGYQAYYGTDETGNGQFSLRKNTNGNNIQVLKNTAVSAGITADEKWHTVKVTPNKAIVDGVDIALTQAGAQYTKSLMLFARITTADTITAYAKCRIASFKIYANGVLVRDYIPVRKGTVGYLYDRVSGKLFGNAGSGDFVLGPDVVPVEYIESHGTEWIDTGVGYFADFDIDVVCPKDTVNCTLSGGSNYSLERYSSTNQVWRLNVGTGVTAIASGSYVYDRHNVSLRSGVFAVDGVEKSTISNRQWGGNATLVFRRSGGTLYSLTLYSLKLWDSSNVLVRSFLPVRIGSGSTWEGALIDTLTRRIYRNAGTGAFAYGNDLKYPIPAS